MTQSARREEVHYCARCRAILAEEQAAEADGATSHEVEREPEAKEDRDSGVIPTNTLRGGAADPPPAPLPTIPMAAIPQVGPEIATESETAIDTEAAAMDPASVGEAQVDDAPTESRIEAAAEHVSHTMTEAALAPPVEPAHEMRSAPRRQVEVDVGIHSDSHFFAGLTGDVSRGGLFVATYAEIAVGAKVTLDFELPNGRVVADGTVRWHRSARDHHSPGFGVQFDHIEPAMLRLIERFCKARPPLYYDQADDV